MIQVKEFVDTDTSYAEKMANDFLSKLQDDQVINISYGSIMKSTLSGSAYQRSAILIVYKGGAAFEKSEAAN
ncbi:sporulation protein Cse60 [Paenibacillus thalictri]|uniref:Sporulation protein Cse60 n=1 Tax=Paenibacillus thalictri TaxID=2527873 RepID=A0A4Q9DNJ2_9BACL|nr:sporulation protein Cse60 [Paenibacillus thalictri]TBL76033.1 sporulation protein Cse60 [Paenibacillus thalictri]